MYSVIVVCVIEGNEVLDVCYHSKMKDEKGNTFSNRKVTGGHGQKIAHEPELT